MSGCVLLTAISLMSVCELALSSPQAGTLTPACVNLASKYNSSKSELFAKREKQKDDCCILQSFVNCYWPFCATLNDTGKNATMVNGPAGANATLEVPACRLFEHVLGQMINYQDSLVACQQKFGTNMCERPLLAGVFGFLGITNQPGGQPTAKKNPTPPPTQEPESGGGSSSGMPIWLIILLIVLILVGIGMIILVVRLFREDKDKTKKHPKHSKSTHTKKSSRK